MTPAIVESALESGLASRASEGLAAFVEDQAGKLVRVPRWSEPTPPTIEDLNGEVASRQQIDTFIELTEEFRDVRDSLKMAGRPFEGFEDEIARFGGRVGDVNIVSYRGSRAQDEAAANALAGIQGTPAGWTWHHHPDYGRMAPIPTDVHNQLRHWGAVAILKQVFGINYR